LRERFHPGLQRDLHRAPRDPASAFVALGRRISSRSFCEEEPRTVGQDNVVAFDGIQACSCQTARAGHLRGSRSPSGVTSRASTPCGAGRSASDTTMRAVMPWPSGTARRPLPDGRPLRRGALRVTRRRLGGVTVMTGQITCQPERTDHVLNATGQITCQQHAPPGPGSSDDLDAAWTTTASGSASRWTSPTSRSYAAVSRDGVRSTSSARYRGAYRECPAAASDEDSDTARP